MHETVQNDGAGGKPQFFTLVGTPKVFRNLGWEIIVMCADDLAQNGNLPCVMVNQVDAKRITDENFPLFEAMMEGYGEALKASNLANITGETAVMKHSITAFCDAGRPDQLVITWGGTCIGIGHSSTRIDPSNIKADMPIVGFLENGYRCNGGTVFTNLMLKLYGPNPNKLLLNPEAISFAERLTIPSVSYAKTICRIIGWNPDGTVGNPLASIVAAANITGGGVWNKLGEILPEGVAANLNHMPDPPEVLLEAQRLSYQTGQDLPDFNCYGDFHGGCGMLVVAKTKKDADKIVNEAQKDNIKAQIVGYTVRQNGYKIRILSHFASGDHLTI